MATKTVDKDLTGLKKRRQIASTNKMIFLWVAVASVVISSCLVILQFLVREGIFNQKIINAKNHTNQILVQNVTNAAALKQKIDALIADPNLSAARTTTSNNNLQVVLDALPARGDDTTFANSLQNTILNRSGSNVAGINTGVGSGAVTGPVAPSEGSSDDADAVSTAQTLPFSVSLTGNFAQIQATLKDIERTIRPISITAMSLQGSDSQLQLSISGVTYYMPEKTVKLGTQTIKP